MTEHELQAAPAEAPRKAMPRPAIRAIAYSGHFCALTSAFLAFFAWRMGFHVGFVALNVAVALFMAAGSQWMLIQLKK